LFAANRQQTKQNIVVCVVRYMYTTLHWCLFEWCICCVCC